ncbi:MAG: RidA family protein [Verrucomicrobia bacterium]|nr:RidA family protein [Verrucomicrobiota bacterium]
MSERVASHGGFSLTPTLSRWERECVSQSPHEGGGLDRRRRRCPFSLSQRERVGVRESHGFPRPCRLSLRNCFFAALAVNTESCGQRQPASPLAIPLVAALGLALVLGGCSTTAPQPAASAKATTSHGEARLKELNLDLPPPSKMPATITGLVRVGNLVFVSGHISRGADGALITGRVGEDLDVASGKVAARQCGLAILSTLRNDLGSLNRVKRVVKVLGLVNCPPGFKDQPAVINGCSELFLDVFGKEAGLGARSAVGVSSLPSNVAVEIEAVFELRP